MIKNHISICVCTYRRPALLGKLLRELAGQRTGGMFTYTIVVADNDSEQSARQVVKGFAASSGIPVTYCLEPEQNIAMARNRALENADGDFIAFIDDDEYPGNDWLLGLFRSCGTFGVDGVLGPVKPYFEQEPPGWVLKGRFFERPEHATGYELDYEETRTGNVLFRREILTGSSEPFRPEFGSGSEDVDFFRRMIEKGFKFVWCNEAAVFELVPPSRCRRNYLLRRALIRGSTFPERNINISGSIARSLVAVPSYVLAMPVLALLGQHVLIKYLIKLFDHSSRLMAFLGWKLIRERDT